MKKLKTSCVLLALMALTACGSGGGGGAASSAGPSDVTPAANVTGSASPGTAAAAPQAAATAGVAKLAWDAPAATEGVRGFRVWYGTASGAYTKSVDVGPANTCTIDGLASGRYYFVVAAYDDAGDQSAYSNEVSKDV